MRMLHGLRAFILAGLLPLLAGGCGQEYQPVDTKPLVEGNTAFACDLYAQLKTSPGNLFFSPYSVSTCLGMTYAGARGETEKQLAQVFHFDTNQVQVHAAFAALQRQLKQAQKSKGVELKLANALWTQKGHAFLPAFLKTGKGDYQAAMDQADFKTGAEHARTQINRWVASQTKDRIQEILPSGSLNAMTRLVLANAIYFKGKWVEPFEPSETTMQPFHLSTNRQVAVPLMHHFDEVKYMENNEYQAIEVPYRGGELAMVVVLPRQVDACGSLEDRLNAALLSAALGQMKERTVEIFLPRFKMESSFLLNDTLARMGMADAFGAKADFSGMDGTTNLFVSDVFHKAWVEVKEEGTEVAAVTAAAASKNSVAVEPPQPPPVFRADHPFVFLIRDTRSGSVLFLGRLADPTK